MDKSYKIQIGNTTSTIFTIRHGLNTYTPQIHMYDTDHGKVMPYLPSTRVVDEHTITLEFSMAPTHQAYLVLITNHE